MDSSTQQNAALVEEATAAARALSEQATGLMNLMDRYRLGRPAAAAAGAQAVVARARSLA
jgi:methyl-accepting chemotaxis protein